MSDPRAASSSHQTFVDPGLTDAARHLRPQRARPNSPRGRPQGNRSSTTADDYVDPSQQQRKMGELGQDRPDSGWVKPEVAKGSATSDVVFGHGETLSTAGERASNTPRHGWRRSFWF